MKENKARNTWDCELLLFFFTVGALAGILYRKETSAFLLAIPGSSVGCMVILLAFDASMTGSLLAGWSLPLVTLAFGAATAMEAEGVLALGLPLAWRQLLLLALITPLHFLLGSWNMHAASLMRRLLRGRRDGSRPYAVSCFFMISAYLVCIVLVFLKLWAQI